MAKSRAQQAAIAISMKKAGKKPKSLSKAQKGISVKPTTDSTKYYDKLKDFYYKQASIGAKYGMSGEEEMKKAAKASKDSFRQQFKNKPGFDKNGFPIKKITTGKNVISKEEAAKIKNVIKGLQRPIISNKTKKKG
jgi:hypothetical protein